MAFALIICLTTSAYAQRDLKDIPSPDPELERQTFQLPEGFEVNLFAADPMLAKPIQMNWDPEGRLWIASSSIYPHIKPGEVADDKVLILEDADHDGVAEKTSVFVEGLLIPTGIEPGDGGVYVANSTELLHLSDTDGDGKADTERVILSGFGTEDTHHILHTLRWGPEQLLYFNQSIYIHSHIETPRGVKRLNGGGIWQFNPNTMNLNVYLRGLVNTWGHDFDRNGQSFATDGAGGEGINYVLPGAYYVTAVGAERILQGLNPGSPKYCGLEIVESRQFPDDWQGSLITNDFRGHRVCRFVLSNDSAGFSSRQEADLIVSDHVAFRPIDVKMGPDGAIYIADWYNPIIQHGEVDFRDPRRDHVHGRIWRVTCKDRPLVEPPSLRTATDAELLDQLTSPEKWTRQQSKRVLAERGTSVLPAVAPWIDRLDKQSPEYDRLRLEAAWVYQSLDFVDVQLIGELLQSPDFQIRAAATRMLGHVYDEIPQSMDWFARMVTDDSPRVRLEAARALTNVGTLQAVEMALTTLDRPVDRYLDYAVWLTVRELKDVWLPAVKSGEFNFKGRADHLVFAAKAVGSPEIVQSLVAIVDEHPREINEAISIYELIGELGGTNELNVLFERALTASLPEVQVKLCDALARAARERNVRPDQNLDRIESLMASDEPDLQLAAIRCIGAWQLTGFKDEMTESLRNVDATLKHRQTALDALASYPGPETVSWLVEIARSDFPHSLRVRAVSALTVLDVATATNEAVHLLADWPVVEDPTQLFTAFLQRKEGVPLLTVALEGTTLPPDVAKAGLRTVAASGLTLPELSAALMKSGHITSEAKSLTPEELQKLVQKVRDEGDAHRGEQVFRRKDLACMNCHSIAGAGGRVGPDLLSIGASAQIDYLIESLLVPNKAVKENYNSLVVLTTTGKVYTGIKVRQSDTELILRDAEDRDVTIPLADIDEQANGVSLMPAGQTDRLTESELVDLVRFMSELGKVGEFAVGQSRIARRWQVLQPTDEAAYVLRRTSYQSASLDNAAFVWQPIYSQVTGDLPVSELPDFPNAAATKAGKRGVSFVRFELDVSTAGPLQIVPNSVNGLTAWIDGVPLNWQKSTIDFETGTHTIVIAIDRSQRDEPLRIELKELPDSPARAQFVLGK
ncbi:MAG: HEAT repeat domain-containing protein [Planctomycetota bacterium]|nr:HEAT repeat domain-containing protein [Planctomycetota bacterium]